MYFIVFANRTLNFAVTLSLPLSGPCFRRLSRFAIFSNDAFDC